MTDALKIARDVLKLTAVQKKPNPALIQLAQAVIDLSALPASGRGDVVPLVERDIELLVAEVERLRVRDGHANECIEARNKRLSEMAVQCDRLRAALVGLVGVDGRDELEAMEFVLRSAPAPDEDKAAAINGIHALLATLTDALPASASPHPDEPLMARFKCNRCGLDCQVALPPLTETPR